MDYLFPLIDRQEVAEGTMEFTFDTTGSDYTFKPGQHTDYTLINPPQTDAEGNTRTFSFVGAPGTGTIKIATRMRDTAFKNSLKAFPLGTKVNVKEPMGRMTLVQDPAKVLVWLVGGIGITPFMGMIHTLQQTGEKRTIYLFYSNPSPQSAAFLSDLEMYAKTQPEFHLVLSYTDAPPADWSGETSRIDATMVKKHLPSLDNTVFYTAGPPTMVSAMIALAETLNIPEERIKSEDFAGY